MSAPSTDNVLPFPAEEANAVRPLPPALSFIAPLPGGLSAPFPDLEALAIHIARRLDGRPFALTPGQGCFAHTRTFPKVTVWATRPGRPLAEAEWIGAAIILSPGETALQRQARDVGALHAALTDAQLFRPVSRA